MNYTLSDVKKLYANGSTVQDDSTAFLFFASFIAYMNSGDTLELGLFTYHKIAHDVVTMLPNGQASEMSFDYITDFLKTRRMNG